MDEQLKQSVLAYHQNPRPGKISVTPPSRFPQSARFVFRVFAGRGSRLHVDLRRATLGAQKYTSRANLVSVVTNGTAVLGFGNIVPLAAKPVMEGKGCLFKKFVGIDVFDIELNETDPDKLVDAIAMLEPTLGGINLEDIKAPECFYIEKKLRERAHEDPRFPRRSARYGDHRVGGDFQRPERVVGKKLEDMKLVCSGAGEAAIACLDLLVDLGRKKSNTLVTDSKGVIYEGRGNLDASKERYQATTDARTLADAMHTAATCVPRLFERGAGVLRPERVVRTIRKPDQQRAVLPVHLPRRAGCGRDDHHRRDEARVCARDRRTRGRNRPEQ